MTTEYVAGAGLAWPPPLLGLPVDEYAGTLVGRVWDPDAGGPSPVLVRDGEVFDVSGHFPTLADLCEAKNPAAAAGAARGRSLGSFLAVLSNTSKASRDSRRPWLLAPVDLQTLKAAGVTFAVSLVERVIEERTRGDFRAAAQLRAKITSETDTDLSRVHPGSDDAARLKDVLRNRGLWSQYLEVGIGPDAEIFTKAPTMAAVGTGMPVGVPKSSTWNNPEPEVALVIDSKSRAIGATLGNDVNLRDVEGRSALLLPRAKDNNASCALGPLLRLFDDTFDIDSVRGMFVRLRVDGPDGFRLDDISHMRQISRDPLDLVAQMTGLDHQYPDGVVLMLGTMFAPVVDRDKPGMGFTHKEGDIVRISSAELGSLVNEVRHCHECEPWTFGVRELMRNLSRRGLIRTESDA